MISGVLPFLGSLLCPLIVFVAPVAGLLQELEASSGAAAYGLLVTTLVLGACLVPVPEEAAFAVGGALSAAGSLSWWGVYAVGWLTVVVLDLALHTIGRRAGPELEQSRIGRRVGAARWAQMRTLVSRRGVWGVAGARFVMGTRVPVFLLAGAMGMPTGRFLGIVAVAGLFSAGLPLLLGYLFGAHLDELLAFLGQARWVLLASVVALAAWWWLRRARS